MSTDVFALILVLGLSLVVVLVGFLRDLSESTRSGLPQFGEDPGQPIEGKGMEGGEVRRALSPMLARWLAVLYLLLSVNYAVNAISSSDDRALHIVFAVALSLLAVFLLSKAKLISSRSTTS